MTVKPKDVNQILAISHMDFHTAKHILHADIDYFLDLDTPECDINEGSTVLLRTWSLLSRLREHVGTTTLVIVCMAGPVAHLMGVPILDKQEHPNSIPIINFNMLWTEQDARPTDTGLRIPLVNVDELLIIDHVEALKREQIMSHVLTFIYTVPRSSHEEVQGSVIDWLGGKLDSDAFLTKYAGRWRKADASLHALYEFMTGKRGAAYIEFFTQVFKGKQLVSETIPKFEVAYFSKLRDKLNLINH